MLYSEIHYCFQPHISFHLIPPLLLIFYYYYFLLSFSERSHILYHFVSLFGPYPLFLKFYQDLLTWTPPLLFPHFSYFLIPSSLLVDFFKDILPQNPPPLFLKILSFFYHLSYWYTSINTSFLKILNLYYFTLLTLLVIFHQYFISKIPPLPFPYAWLILLPHRMGICSD